MGSWRSSVALALTFACVVAAACPAAADEPHAIALYLGAFDDEESEVRAAGLLARLLPPVLDAEIDHAAVLGTAGEVAVLGAQSVERCDDDAISVNVFGTWLTELEGGYQSKESIDAKAAQLAGAWACLAAPVDPAKLAQASYVRGLDAYSENDEEGASAAFAQVHAVDPAFEWNPNHSPKAQVWFARALEEVARAPRTTLHVALGDVAVVVDGRPVEDPLVGVALAPGRHLVQVERAKGWTGIVVEVDGAGRVLLTDRRALERRDREAEEALAFGEVLLASLAAEDRAPDHLVVLGPIETVLQWSGAAVVRAPLAEAAPEASPRVKKLRTGGAVLTGVGLGVALGGSAMAALGQQSAADAQAAAEFEGPDGTVYLDPAKWTLYEDDYLAGRDLNRGGWVMVGVGSAAAVTGLILLARGAHLNRSTPQATAVVTPDGAYLSLSGRF